MVEPVASSQRLHDITPDRQPPRLPLPQDMEVLMQDEVGIAPESRGGVSQQDAIAAGRGASAEVQARIERVLDDPHVRDRLTEDFLERCVQRRGKLLRSGAALTGHCSSPNLWPTFMRRRYRTADRRGVARSRL